MSIKFSGKNSPIGQEKKFRKEETRTVLFYHEKIFHLDGIYDSENDHIWGVNLEEANRRGGKKKQQEKFAEKVMGWSEGLAPLVLFEKGTLHHHQGCTAYYSTIRKQLDLRTRQRNTADSSRNKLVLPTFLDKDTWPADSPNLNLLDYCIWDESAQAVQLE